MHYFGVMVAARQIICQSNNGGLFMSINNTSWSAASDERLNNMHDGYHNPLASVKESRPIKFPWNK